MLIQRDEYYTYFQNLNYDYCHKNLNLENKLLIAFNECLNRDEEDISLPLYIEEDGLEILVS
jgi:hypothetical protein